MAGAEQVSAVLAKLHTAGSQNVQMLTSELRIINPVQWRDEPVPERQWIVRDMIPANTVTLLSGDGAVGKSTLALQLGTARALGRDWIGTVPSAGRTLHLSAE